MCIESVMPSNHLILCRPLLLPPSIFLSIRVFSNESVLHIRWPKYWSLTFTISPSNEYSRLISFRVDWLDLLAVQGTLKSLLQHHSSKALLCLTIVIPLTKLVSGVKTLIKNHLLKKNYHLIFGHPTRHLLCLDSSLLISIWIHDVGYIGRW